MPKSEKGINSVKYSQNFMNSQSGHAQADRSLHWVHRSFCWFYSAAAQILKSYIEMHLIGLKFAPVI